MQGIKKLTTTEAALKRERERVLAKGKKGKKRK